MANQGGAMVVDRWVAVVLMMDQGGALVYGLGWYHGWPFVMS